MELQQQQQQLISMEGFDNSTVRVVVSKLINVTLALLAVILVLINTVVNLVGPFLNTRSVVPPRFLFYMKSFKLQKLFLVKRLARNVDVMLVAALML